MIGIDIVRIERVESDFDLLSKRILSKRELEQMKTRPLRGQYEYLAGRFASKEAYVKASGNKSVTYREVETLDDMNGRPHLYYRGKEIGEVSIAHDGYAVAVVFLPGTKGEQ
jgi:holo-[acyl-carrier protein] synthase